MSPNLARRLMMASRPPKDPLIAVIGATGTGKSKLAIELATRFNGEIINGDAMQMYRGLPIITNKIPESQRGGVPHHLLDFVELHEQPWTVRNFVAECQRTIREIRSRGRRPILVGGTHYYTQALLFRDSLPEGEHDVESANGGGKIWPILSASTEEMHARLQELDPEIAKRWHPQDRRHIQRSLEICLQTGGRASEVYLAQKENREKPTRPGMVQAGTSDNEEDAPTASHGLRCPTLVLWTDVQEDVLKARLDARVDDMVADGLLDEASSMVEFGEAMASQHRPLETGSGIWVSIGCKEMRPYLDSVKSGERDEKMLVRLYDECLEAVKAGTRQYAKRQRRWIRHRLFDALSDASAQSSLYLLDCTDPDRWSANATIPSQHLVASFLNGGELPIPAELSDLAKKTFEELANTERKRVFEARRCETCDKILMTGEEWDRHLKSRGHLKVLQSIRRGAMNEARRQVEVSSWPTKHQSL